MAIRTNRLGQPIGPAIPDWVPPEAPSDGPLEGRSCIVERLDPGRHGHALFEANALDAEGRNWTYLPYGPFEDYASYEDWLNEVAAGEDPKFYAVVDKATDQAAGVASYLSIVPAWGSIEVGHINYSPLLQRRRAATEAMFLMMKHVFELGYRRYEWRCDALNEPSRSAARRLGFSFEGVFRNAMAIKGRNRDTAWFSVIDSEWPFLRDAFERWLDPDNFDADGRQKAALSSLTQAALAACRDARDGD